MNGSLLQLALRKLRGVFASRVSRFALMIAIFVLTVSGPFGTFEGLNLGQRLAYWAVMVLASYVTGHVVVAVLLEWLRRWIAQRWPRAIVSALITGLPVTLIVFGVNAVTRQRLEWALLLPIWSYATLTTVVVVVAMVALADRLRAAAATSAQDAPAASPPPPPILERVPLPQRGRLLALIVEDHYVDVVTDRGKALVLMRLADAMREAAGVAGLQIDRSHWVALDAVVKAHRSEGKLTLELSNGLRLPVSRGYAAAVKEAGLA